MSVDRHLLEILVCPTTKVPVVPLSRDKLAVLNREIEAGRICTRDGKAVGAPLEAALVTSDGKTVYPVRDDIPVMLEEEAIACAQVAGW